MAEDPFSSSSHRHIRFAQAGLSQSVNFDAQRLNLIWAWPIISVMWNFIRLIRFMGLKPIYICLTFYLAGSEMLDSDEQLPIPTATDLVSQRQSSSSQLNLEHRFSSIPLFPISPCRGQERSPSSLSKERTILLSPSP